MVSKHFKLVCTLRVAGITVSVVLFFVLFMRTVLYASMIAAALAVVYQTWSLMRYVDKSNRDLTRFLLAIKHSDFSLSYSDEGRGGSHKDLRAAFNDVLIRFRKARAEREESYRYLQTVVQHVGVGLIAFGPDGAVDLVNNAAKRLLDVAALRNVEDLANISRPLVDALLSLETGQKSLVKVDRAGESLQLSLSATEFKTGQRTIKLVSLQNITSELVEKETEAWQQLVRVLTHEIMNSVTPIASLAATARNLLDASVGGDSAPRSGGNINGEAVTDLRSAIETIGKRSEGLTHFVEAYRNLARIPAPEFQIVPISEVFARVEQLIVSRPDCNDIAVSRRADPDSLELTADPDLVEQVLLNLTINSVQALAGRTGGLIEMKAYLDDRSRVVIQVADNGPGIRPEAMDSIFVPFFTTKPEGSGIGLSLSRRIMRVHNGDLTAASVPDERTVFTLRF